LVSIDGTFHVRLPIHGYQRLPILVVILILFPLFLFVLFFPLVIGVIEAGITFSIEAGVAFSTSTGAYASVAFSVRSEASVTFSLSASAHASIIFGAHAGTSVSTCTCSSFITRNRFLWNGAVLGVLFVMEIGESQRAG
jgi:ABC-type nickel/cobalt efflux system permease component RcnA